MDIPTPDDVLAAFSRRLFRFSLGLEHLARAGKGLLPQDDLTVIWAAQRELYLTARSVCPVPPPKPEIPDHL